MVRIVLPVVWAVDGKSTYETDAGPLPDVIKQFVAENPAYRRRILGPDSEPAGYLNICVDDDLVPRHERATTVVPAGSVVTIIPPMAGG